MRGKVVLVPFPFDDLSSTKVRPALCLTDLLGEHRHVILAFITSTVSVSPEPSDVAILPSDAEFGSTGLRVPSMLRLHRVVTVSSSLIRRELGTLGPGLETRVRAKLRDLFGL